MRWQWKEDARHSVTMYQHTKREEKILKQGLFCGESNDMYIHMIVATLSKITYIRKHCYTRLVHRVSFLSTVE